MPSFFESIANRGDAPILPYVERVPLAHITIRTRQSVCETWWRDVPTDAELREMFGECEIVRTARSPRRPAGTRRR